MPYIDVIKIVSLALGTIIGLYGVYFFLIGINFIRKEKTYPETENINHFAILIPARNEEAVIERIIRSLQELNYPSDAFDIIVLANNCNDKTVAEAEKTGACVLEYRKNIHNKGDVLHQAFLNLRHSDYDAYIIFDADNTVHPDFLKEMNKVLDAGYDACQGFREGQNPGDSYISASYSIYMLLVDLFYNHPRSVLGMNAMITGTGFMISNNLIEKLGGWNTSTLTEDLEFTVQNSLAGQHIAYASKAVSYDEQVSSLSQSLVQRTRWSKGVKQVLHKMGIPAIKSMANKEGKNVFDSLLMISGTYMNNISLFVSILTILFFNFVNPIFDGRLRFILLNFLFIFLLPTLFALFITLYFKKPLKHYGKGILMFWFFLLTWMPVNIYAHFSKSVEWKEIKHGVEREIPS